MHLKRDFLDGNLRAKPHGKDTCAAQSHCYSTSLRHGLSVILRELFVGRAIPVMQVWPPGADMGFDFISVKRIKTQTGWQGCARIARMVFSCGMRRA
jgi:hypothetical protein